MIKRILVALDRDIETPIATRYAINMATEFKASLTGLAVVDIPTINTVVGGGGIGTIHYAQQLKEKLIEESRETAKVLLKNFKEVVKNEGVDYTKDIFEGVPHKRIIEDSKYHDILVIGKESHFYNDRPELETKTLATIVKKGLGPTLMVLDKYRPIQKIVVAHDGSKASAKALQWFVQLQPFGRNMHIDIVYACTKEKEEVAEKGNKTLNLAYDYLKTHGYDQVNKVLLEGNTGAAKQIIKYVRDTEADMITVGAHSVSAIRRLTFGSVTHELVNKSPVPLFLCS